MFEFSWPWAFLLLPLPWILRRFTASTEQAKQRLRMPMFAQFSKLAPSLKESKQGTNWFEALVWLCLVLSLIHISEPTRQAESRMPSSA